MNKPNTTNKLPLEGENEKVATILDSVRERERMVKRVPSSEAFFKPLPVKQSKATAASKSNGRLEVKASSLKEKAVTGLTAAALTASMIIPEVAEAAGSGVSPSLKNFLLSIVAGGVVLVVLVGAVIGVSNFDPVKRG